MRYFKFVGDPNSYHVYEKDKDVEDDYKFFNQFIFRPEKGETYKGSNVFFYKNLESLAETYFYGLITLEKFINERSYCSNEGGFNADRDWVDVTNKLLDEEAFINQCAIGIISGYITIADKIDRDKIKGDSDLAKSAFDLAEIVNEERKKRLKS